MGLTAFGDSSVPLGEGRGTRWGHAGDPRPHAPVRGRVSTRPPPVLGALSTQRGDGCDAPGGREPPSPGSGRPAAPPPLSPLQSPQAPRPRVPPGQHEASAGGAEPGTPTSDAPRRDPRPAPQQQVAAAGQQVRAAAGRVLGGHPQRAAPAPRALLAAPEHGEHGHREARPRAARLPARAHRHLHRCGEGGRASQAGRLGVGGAGAAPGRGLP